MKSRDQQPRGAGDRSVTELLAEARAGDGTAETAVYEAVYEDLRRLARGQRRKLSRQENTLNTTALVHESYLRLSRGSSEYNDREHFMAVAATAMRQILVDRARHRMRSKRGAGERPLTLDDGHAEDAGAVDAATLISLDGALKKLGAKDLRLQQVVECQFFGGMTRGETATALGLSERSIRRFWVKARAWLKLQLDSRAA